MTDLHDGGWIEIRNQCLSLSRNKRILLLALLMIDLDVPDPLVHAVVRQVEAPRSL
jgi:hypothetical protein